MLPRTVSVHLRTWTGQNCALCMLEVEHNGGRHCSKQEQTRPIALLEPRLGKFDQIQARRNFQCTYNRRCAKSSVSRKHECNYCGTGMMRQNHYH